MLVFQCCLCVFGLNLPAGIKVHIKAVNGVVLSNHCYDKFSLNKC